jgi:alkylation response protein AidB-like acyl-CoA dehydrogenase
MNPTANDWPARAGAIAREVLARHADDVDRRGRWPAESVAALAEAGLLGLTVPAEFGGAGEGPRTFAAVLSALSEQCASSAMIYLMHVCAAQVFALSTDYAGREPVLRAMAAGRHLSTLAFSEKGSRSHFWAPVSQASPRDGGARLTAEKSFVTSAGHADSYVVSTRSADGAEPTASTLYAVPRDANGLTVGDPWNGLGLRGNASAPMRLEGVTAHTSERLSGEGNGLNVMLSVVLPWFQLGSAAVAVGIARAATDGIRRHLRAAKLEHLGQSLADLPTLRARLAQMQVAVDTQQAFLGHVAGRMETPGPHTLLAVLESKAAAAEAALQVTDLALRVGGGAAFARRLPVERNFRDARALAVMAPTTDVLYDFIARSLLDMPLL